MATKHGRLAQVTVASQALGTFCDSADISYKIDTADTSVFQALAVAVPYKSYLPGLAGGELQLSGVYDPTVTTGPDSVMTLNFGLIIAVVFYPAGNNAGAGTSHTFNSIITLYRESSKVTDNVTFAATLLMTGAPTIAQL